MKATFGAGCFWHVEETFRKVKGVTNTTVGYMGGSFKNPTYEDVCSDSTGHAEVIHIEFDKISYQDILKVFWKIHDPTQLNRQGLDIGTQYRSVIFYHNKNQRKLALDSLLAEQKKRGNKVVTQIEPASIFYKAEEYHQKYIMKKGLKSC